MAEVARWWADSGRVPPARKWVASLADADADRANEKALKILTG